MISTDKANKTKYGKIVAFKQGATIYKFRPPTCDELVKYQRMSAIDIPAAKYYILRACAVEEYNLDTLQPQIIEKVEEFFDKEANMLSVDGYKQTKLEMTNISPIIMLIYNFAMTYNMSVDYLLSLSANELMQTIVIIEKLTNTKFIDTENNGNTGFKNEEDYRKQMGDAFQIAAQRIQQMKKDK